MSRDSGPNVFQRGVMALILLSLLLLLLPVGAAYAWM